MRRLLVASVALGAMLSAAKAADLPITVPASVPGPIAFNWTGFYAGAHAGYTWGKGDATYNGNGPFLAGVVGTGLAPGGYGLNTDGFLGGVQLGYNQQFNQFVFGVEGDFSFLNANDSVTAFSVVGPNSLTSTAGTDINWLATLRARLGFTFDRFLVYGTGGFAFGSVEASGNIVGGGGLAGLAWAGNERSTRTGWTIGAGAEWAFTPNLTARLEYLYYDLGDANVTVGPLNAATAATGIFATQRHDVNGHIVRAGVNFRF